MRKQICFFLLACLSLQAGTYTNVVGKTIQGKVTAITEKEVTIAGREFNLSIFPVSEQKRMMAEMGETELLLSRFYKELRQKRAFYEEQAVRLRSLRKAGLSSEEDYQKKCEALRKAWERDLSQAVDLDESVRRALMDSIRI